MLEDGNISLSSTQQNVEFIVTTMATSDAKTEEDYKDTGTYCSRILLKCSRLPKILWLGS